MPFVVRRGRWHRHSPVRSPCGSHCEGERGYPFDGFERVFDTFSTTGRRPTGTAADHEWTDFEERYCAHHRDAGASQLGDLLGVTGREVVDHMGALGVEVAPVPLLGEVCPSCGRRMPVEGPARRRGVCDACNTRILMELRSSYAADREAYNVSRKVSMGEWRADGKGVPEVRQGGSRGD